MKANELMIGDWMCCTDPTPFKIEAITIIDFPEYVTGDDGFDVEISDLQPIPLTEEILRANFPNAYHNVFWYFNDRVSNEIDFLYEIHIVKNIDEELTLNLRYVHELQHALRLCGIEKEIEL